MPWSVSVWECLNEVGHVQKEPTGRPDHGQKAKIKNFQHVTFWARNRLAPRPICARFSSVIKALYGSLERLYVC